MKTEPELQHNAYDVWTFFDKCYYKLHYHYWRH